MGAIGITEDHPLTEQAVLQASNFGNELQLLPAITTMWYNWILIYYFSFIAESVKFHDYIFAVSVVD